MSRLTRRASRFEPRMDSLEAKTMLSTVAGLPVARPLAAEVAPATSNSNTFFDLQQDRFRLSGGKTTYDLKFTSGQYRFTQNLEQKIKTLRDGHGVGITAIEALRIFQDRAYAHIDRLLQGTPPVTPQQVNGVDYVIDKENFSNRGGRTTYNLTITSGQYRFEMQYSMKINRVNRGPNIGLTALESLDLFTDRFYRHVEHRLTPVV